MRKKTAQNRLHEYYTPKSIIFQGFLFKITIFVNYADFYVNIIMLTNTTDLAGLFVIFNYFAIYRAPNYGAPLNVEFAAKLAKAQRWVKNIYLL